MLISIWMVRALAGAVERAGGSRELFLQTAQVDPQLLEDTNARLPVLEYLRVIDAALQVSNDPALGLHMGERTSPAMFDLFGYLVGQAGTLRQAFETILRYSRLAAEGHEPQLSEADETASIRFPLLVGDAAAVRLTAEFAMTGLLSQLKLCAGESARPSRVLFGYEAPAYLAEYQRIFGAAAQFGHSSTEMEFPSEWLDRAQPYRSPDLYALLKEEAERALSRLDRDAPWSERIALLLASRSPSQLPTMEGMASELGVSVRSLRRWLQSEGSNYADLVDRARTAAAKRMLGDPRASIQEVAFAMGFADQTTFHRAFKRWTGQTPKQYKSSF
jgi:AraC-like DNA-binding protein